MTTRTVVSTPNGASAVGPYSQAITAQGVVFVAGQVALDPVTQQIVGGGVEAHTQRAIRNVEAILEATGSGLGAVVRCVV